MRSKFRDMADKSSGHGIWSNKISKEKRKKMGEDNQGNWIYFSSEVKENISVKLKVSNKNVWKDIYTLAMYREVSEF